MRAGKYRWQNEGEKNSKYFLNLEKGVIIQLKLGDNKFASSNKEILSECETFYKNSYSSKTNCDDSQIMDDLCFGSTASKPLNFEEKEKCERGMLTTPLTSSKKYETWERPQVRMVC